MSLSKTVNLQPASCKRRRQKCCLLVDERVGHDAQLLNLSALFLCEVLHGLLGVEAGPLQTVLDLPLVLP